jgi:hypothetical protein
LSWIWIISGELVQLTSEMFSSPRVIVPVCVDSIGSNKVCTFVATITAVSAVGAIIFSAPPTVTSRVPVDVTYLAGDVDVGHGATIATATTIIAAATIIIIATGAVVTVLLARAVLAPAIIIAGPLILAWTAIIIARALLLALVLMRTAVIIAWVGVTASHVCRGGEARLFGLVLPIERLDLGEELGEGGVGVGVDGGAEVVVVAAEALQDIVEELIIIK